MFSKERAASLLLGALLVTAGCGGNNGTLPGSPGAGGASQLSLDLGGVDSPADTTSILKKLTKDLVIGTTVDAKNGDTGPHSLEIVGANYGLKKGQLVTCNFADSSGSPGNGTTIEVLNPTVGSKPSTFATNAKVKGCDGNAITSGNSVYACGLTSGVCLSFNQKGKSGKTFGTPIVKPFADGDIFNPQAYAAEYIMVGDAKTGGVVSFAVGAYGNPKETQVISGFGTSGSGWSALGPSGFQYDTKKDVMYIVDGNTNTIVSVSHPGNLLVKNEIVVQPGGKTFKCAHPKDSCAKLVLAGSPLNGPVALALLPNGNLIAANTKDNKLVELTPAGQVLATKVADHGGSPAVLGLAATGKNDTNTTLFYTDKNDNNVHQLQQ